MTTTVMYLICIILTRIARSQRWAILTPHVDGLPFLIIPVLALSSTAFTHYRNPQKVDTQLHASAPGGQRPSLVHQSIRIRLLVLRRLQLNQINNV